MTNHENMGNQLIDDLLERAEALGRTIEADFDAVRIYTSERLLHLAAATTEPGYLRAVMAERDNVALRLGIAAVRGADAADRELLGMIGGAIAIGARALAAGGA